jgi:hypothetical protein
MKCPHSASCEELARRLKSPFGVEIILPSGHSYNYVLELGIHATGRV